MNFFKFLNFPLKSIEIPIGLRFQIASVTINFINNRDYRAVLYSMPPTRTARPIHHRRSHQSFGRRRPWGPPSDNAASMDPHDDRFESAKAGAVAGSQNDGRAPSDARDSSTYRVHT